MFRAATVRGFLGFRFLAAIGGCFAFCWRTEMLGSWRQDHGRGSLIPGNLGSIIGRRLSVMVVSDLMVTA